MRDGSKTSDYDYDLPPSLIAQRPLSARDTCRLMIVDRAAGRITHARFSDLPHYVQPGDVLVRNTTKVFNARLLGARAGGGAAEVLLLNDNPDGTWDAMVKPGARLREGAQVSIGPDFSVEIVAVLDSGLRRVRLLHSGDVHEIIERHGHVPLPPYITRSDDESDEADYQTVYAAVAGSVAAPTAGLHFTGELLNTLRDKGASVVDVVLHVGAGTFKPVDVEDPAEHTMHTERYWLPDNAADTVRRARHAESAIWAVGTTSARCLEAAALSTPWSKQGATNLFLRPPATLKVVDHLITNFHLPRSTLMMLVAAFAGYDLTMEAYHCAVREKYRFFSYGDAMVLL